MELLNYGVNPPKRRMPWWVKFSGGALVLLLLLGIVALIGIVLFLWLCVWLLEKIVPML